MNRKLRAFLKSADGAYTFNGYLRLVSGEMAVDVEAPNVFGDGERLDRADLKSALGTKLGKEGTIRREGDALLFERGNMRAKVAVLDHERFGDAPSAYNPPPGRIAIPADVAAEAWHPALGGLTNVMSAELDWTHAVAFEDGVVVATDGYRVYGIEGVTRGLKERLLADGYRIRELARLDPRVMAVVPMPATDVLADPRALIVAGDGWTAYLPSLGKEYFPDWRRVMRWDDVQEPLVTVEDEKGWKDALQAANALAERIRVMSGKSYTSVTLTQAGDLVHERFEAAGVFSPAPFEVRMHPVYLREAIEYLGAAGLTMGFTGPTTSIMMRNGDRFAVLMPQK